jgi:hypothetical protein
MLTNQNSTVLKGKTSKALASKTEEVYPITPQKMHLQDQSHDFKEV